MRLQSQIEHKIQTAFSPIYLQIENESHQHAVPKDSETHFKIIIVTDQFKKKTLLERHRMVHKVLEQELVKSLHALQLKCYTLEEWEKREGKTSTTPPCRGGFDRK